MWKRSERWWGSLYLPEGTWTSTSITGRTGRQILSPFSVCHKMLWVLCTLLWSAEGAPLELITATDWLDWSGRLALWYWSCGGEEFTDQAVVHHRPPDHPLHHLLGRQRSTFFNRLVQAHCHKDSSRNTIYLYYNLYAIYLISKLWDKKIISHFSFLTTPLSQHPPAASRRDIYSLLPKSIYNILDSKL